MEKNRDLTNSFGQLLNGSCSENLFARRLTRYNFISHISRPFKFSLDLHFPIRRVKCVIKRVRVA